jgi:hypothetical protein
MPVKGRDNSILQGKDCYVTASLISGEFIDTPFLTPEDMRYIKDNTSSIELSCNDRLATFIRKV